LSPTPTAQHRSLRPPQPRRRRLRRRLPVALRATLSPDYVRLQARASLSPCRWRLLPPATPSRVHLAPFGRSAARAAAVFVYKSSCHRIPADRRPEATERSRPFI